MMAKYRVLITVLALSISSSACGGSHAAGQTTQTRTKASTTTTEAPTTTTTVTSGGGFIASTSCPYYPVEADGYSGIHDGGTEIYFQVSASPESILKICSSQLKALGWSVGPQQAIPSGGSSLQARQGQAFAEINVSTDPAHPRVAVCTWPTQPLDLSCPFMN